MSAFCGQAVRAPIYWGYAGIQELKWQAWPQTGTAVSHPDHWLFVSKSPVAITKKPSQKSLHFYGVSRQP
ncbi:MAG: hypothetical protein M5U34_31155 [Chloroflexi bacterium]|nr:hypothetical protein [Chloroflexota bacterium]